MLSRPDFLLPLAAADRQFREHYYGLNSAALLEDLFYDALGNYIKQVEPATALVRPPAGQKGWDYEYEGVKFSHKVAQSIGAIAAIWDATIVVDRWTVNEPVVYSVTENAPAKGIRVTLPTGSEIRTRSLASLNRNDPLGGRSILMVEWPQSSRTPKLISAFHGGANDSVGAVLPFAQAWASITDAVTPNRAINEIDFLVSARALSKSELQALAQEAPIDIAAKVRAGFYVFPRSELVDLEVERNNRAVLIPKRIVEQLVANARAFGHFVPMPRWYGPYAADTPPDMYLAQRREFDLRFSARGAH
ncbi:hypothetical protein [Demequina rhizosphaerae]|uniref:hypothetical protein n=1 Tax=Demequina rhizosphaerae TaxID=1638985 RepID=UPI00078116D6|nr:hypothetical protein [Demequina rhizosphaerae]